MGATRCCRGGGRPALVTTVTPASRQAISITVPRPHARRPPPHSPRPHAARLPLRRIESDCETRAPCRPDRFDRRVNLELAEDVLHVCLDGRRLIPSSIAIPASSTPLGRGQRGLLAPAREGREGICGPRRPALPEAVHQRRHAVGRQHELARDRPTERVEQTRGSRSRGARRTRRRPARAPRAGPRSARGRSQHAESGRP